MRGSVTSFDSPNHTVDEQSDPWAATPEVSKGETNHRNRKVTEVARAIANIFQQSVRVVFGFSGVINDRSTVGEATEGCLGPTG